MWQSLVRSISRRLQALSAPPLQRPVTVPLTAVPVADFPTTVWGRECFVPLWFDRPAAAVPIRFRFDPGRPVSMIGTYQAAAQFRLDVPNPNTYPVVTGLDTPRGPRDGVRALFTHLDCWWHADRRGQPLRLPIIFVHGSLDPVLGLSAVQRCRWSVSGAFEPQTPYGTLRLEMLAAAVALPVAGP